MNRNCCWYLVDCPKLLQRLTSHFRLCRLLVSSSCEQLARQTTVAAKCMDSGQMGLISDSTLDSPSNELHTFCTVLRNLRSLPTISAEIQPTASAQAHWRDGMASSHCVNHRPLEISEYLCGREPVLEKS